MGLLKHFRSKSRLKDKDSPQAARFDIPPSPARYGRDFSQRIPDNVLERIFALVCPHSQDETYEPSERSMLGDGCLLCDMRDLASCTRVCRKWYHNAQKML